MLYIWSVHNIYKLVCSFFAISARFIVRFGRNTIKNSEKGFDLKKLSIFMILTTFININVHAGNNLANLIFKVPAKSQILESNSSIKCQDCTIPERFTVSVWNMYKGSEPSWPREYQSMDAQSDLILGQEFLLSGDMKTELENPVNSEVVMATSFINTKKEATGVFTSSKVSSISKKAYRSQSREPLANTPKMGLVTSYPLSNGEVLTVVNIHALNFVGIIPFYNQVSELIDEVKDLEGPIIFAGDFNTNTPSKTISMNLLFKAQGFKKTEFSGKDDRLTFLGQKLDHFWYRGLQLLEARVLNENEGSDHKPMQATFEVSY